MLDDGHPGDFQAASREFVDGIGWWMLDGWMLDGNNQHWWLPSTVFVLQTFFFGALARLAAAGSDYVRTTSLNTRVRNGRECQPNGGWRAFFFFIAIGLVPTRPQSALQWASRAEVRR